MASDRLYELAIQFRKTSLWKRMHEDQLFAVKLAGGRIGYASCMGILGEHQALALYIGEEGLRCYHILRETSPDPSIGYIPAVQNNAGIHVSFEARDDLPEEALAEARDFASRNGIRFAGKNAFPMFFKAEPGYAITMDLTEQDEEDLEAALLAALEVAKDTELSSRNTGDFPGIDRTSREIVLMEPKDGAYLRTRIPLPRLPEYEPPAGEIWDELAAARISRLPKKGTWQMGLVTTMIETGWEHSDRPILPVILLAIDMDVDEAIQIRPVALYESRTNVMLNMLMEGIGEHASRPARIEVEDDFTEALLGNWCRKMKIRLVRKEALPQLQQARRGLLRHLKQQAYGSAAQDDEITILERMIDAMLSLPPELLANLPPEMTQMLEDARKELTFMPDAPEWLLEDMAELEVRIEAARGISRAKAGNKSSQRSGRRSAPETVRMYVLSVSLGTGCYRHIRVPENIVLAELAEVILWAFEFINDHAHAFFMDNHAWSHQDCYYCPGIDDHAPSTENFRLQDTGLQEGQKFKFVFDFGEGWIFQCRALRISELPVESEDAGVAEIIRSKGEPPAQYEMPGFDPDEEWLDPEDEW